MLLHTKVVVDPQDTACVFTISNSGATAVAVANSQVVRNLCMTEPPGSEGSAQSVTVEWVNGNGAAVDRRVIAVDTSAAAPAPGNEFGYTDQFWQHTFDAAVPDTVFLVQASGASTKANVCTVGSNAVVSDTSDATSGGCVQFDTISGATALAATHTTHSAVAAVQQSAARDINAAGELVDGWAMQFDGFSGLHFDDVNGDSTTVGTLLSTLNAEHLSLSAWVRCDAPACALVTDFSGACVNAVTADAPTVPVGFSAPPFRDSTQNLNGTVLTGWAEFQAGNQLRYGGVALRGDTTSTPLAFGVAMFVRFRDAPHGSNADPFMQLVQHRGVQIGYANVNESYEVQVRQDGVPRASVPVGQNIWQQVRVTVTTAGVGVETYVGSTSDPFGADPFGTPTLSAPSSSATVGAWDQSSDATLDVGGTATLDPAGSQPVQADRICGDSSGLGCLTNSQGEPLDPPNVLPL